MIKNFQPKINSPKLSDQKMAFRVGPFQIQTELLGRRVVEENSSSRCYGEVRLVKPVWQEQIERARRKDHIFHTSEIFTLSL